MSPNRPTDQQLADALRRELPARVVPGLRDRILAEAATTPQVRAGARLHFIPKAEPGWRAILVAAALLLLLAIGTALVGSILDDVRNKLGLDAAPPKGVIAVSANPVGFNGGENGDIYLLGNGSPPRRVIGSDGDGIAQACPRFAPDGLRLAYGEGRATGNSIEDRGSWPVDDRAIVIVRLAAGGSGTEPIVRVPLPAGRGTLTCPKWSPTGLAVAFRDGEQLWVADAVSGAVRTFSVSDVAGRFSSELEWSRDGAKIAVMEPRQIHVVAVDTGESTMIPVSGEADVGLGWTAGDAGLVYESEASIHLAGVDGTDRILVTLPTPEDADYPLVTAAVSPDGTSVAILHDPFHCTTSTGCLVTSVGARIVITDLFGTPTAELPLPAGLPTWTDGARYWAEGISWSPDGKRLLLSSAAGIVSIGRDARSPAVIHATGLLGTPLNLRLSWHEVSWQPVRD